MSDCDWIIDHLNSVNSSDSLCWCVLTTCCTSLTLEQYESIYYWLPLFYAVWLDQMLSLVWCKLLSKFHASNYLGFSCFLPSVRFRVQFVLGFMLSCVNQYQLRSTHHLLLDLFCLLFLCFSSSFQILISSLLSALSDHLISETIISGSTANSLHGWDIVGYSTSFAVCFVLVR